VLLRDTLLSVLASPGAPEAADDEVSRLFRPVWPEGLPSHALVLTGIRRSGKSTLQHQIRRELGGASVVLNLEDPRLYGLGAEDFATVLSVLDAEHPRASVYLDEVQEVPEWPRLVRALLDTRRRVCVTGSTASLLGRESRLEADRAPHLARGLPLLAGSSWRSPGTSRAPPHSDHLRRGLRGRPAGRAGPRSRPAARAPADVVHRDVTRRSLRSAHRVTLALHLLAHLGQPLSLQALAKGLGLPSVAQTGRLVEYLQDAWLVLAAPRFSPSFRRRVTSPPKYYAVDTGLAAASSPNPTPDLGRKLENAVLLALRRRGASPAFAAAPHEWECDFVTKDLAIQCCVRLTPENRERELRGLDQAADLPGRAGKRDLLIVTLDQEDSLREGGRRIRVVPAWKWLD
jgi:predicted AAA+ superfamily ATPase